MIDFEKLLHAFAILFWSDLKLNIYLERVCQIEIITRERDTRNAAVTLMDNCSPQETLKLF
jgi:hypothetical protein